jgi:hypothetical protein
MVLYNGDLLIHVGQLVSSEQQNVEG